MNSRKTAGAVLGTLGGLTALTAASAEIFYNFSINTKSPIHMSKLNNLIQKMASKSDGEDSSAKYSGLTGTPEIREWYDEHGEDVFIMSDSLRLHGRKFENPGSDYVLVCHGYTSKARHMAGFVHKFHSLGFNVLAVDARAHGESEGTKIGMGWPERMDVIEWIKLILSWDPDARIILHGVSMGAATVLMAAGLDLPENVKGIIADCPYSSPKDIIRKVAKDMHMPDRLSWPFVKIGGRVYGGFDVDETDAARAVKQATVPILIIHGESDSFVPCEMSDIVSENPTLITRCTFPGADHGFSYLVDTPRYRKIVTEFMEKVLAPKA